MGAYLNSMPDRKYFRVWQIAALLASLAVALVPAPPATSQAQNNRQLNREATQPRDQSPRRIALVIGNGAYTNAPPLKNPPNDATLVATTLKKLGFEVTLGTNRSQREMKQLIREFGQRLRAVGGVGLFYFAGHGVQSSGHNYLIPIDADIQTEADVEDVGVDVNYVLKLIDDAQSSLNIVILDACRNNPFARSFRSAQGGLAQVKAPTGTLIAYATSPDSTAADGDRTNSPYTEELTKQMDIPGVVLETMFRRVTEQVSARTQGKQEPWISDNHKGDFYFKSAADSRSSTSDASKLDAVGSNPKANDTSRPITDGILANNGPSPTSGSKSYPIRALSVSEDPRMIGKRRLVDVPTSSLNAENTLGRNLAAEVISNAPILDDAVIKQYINRIGQNIVLHSDSKVPFTIQVIDSPALRVFALPGGYLYVSSGLILSVGNEAELAALIAHHLAHVVLRHGITKSERTRDKSLTAFTDFDFDAELQADLLAVQYLWACGYEPNALSSGSARIVRNQTNIIPAFVSHLVTEVRLEKMRELISQFPVREYVTNTEEFSAVTERLTKVTRTKHTEE